MPLYNLIEYSNNYSNTLGDLGQYHNYYSDDNMTDTQTLYLFKFKVRTTERTPAAGNTKD